MLTNTDTRWPKYQNAWGVSSHSLYKWVKAVQPDKTEQQAAELVEAKTNGDFKLKIPSPLIVVTSTTVSISKTPAA